MRGQAFFGIMLSAPLELACCIFPCSTSAAITFTFGIPSVLVYSLSVRDTPVITCGWALDANEPGREATTVRRRATDVGGGGLLESWIQVP